MIIVITPMMLKDMNRKFGGEGRSHIKEIWRDREAASVVSPGPVCMYACPSMDG